MEHSRHVISTIHISGRPTPLTFGTLLSVQREDGPSEWEVIIRPIADDRFDPGGYHLVAELLVVDEDNVDPTKPIATRSVELDGVLVRHHEGTAVFRGVGSAG